MTKTSFQQLFGPLKALQTFSIAQDIHIHSLTGKAGGRRVHVFRHRRPGIGDAAVRTPMILIIYCFLDAIKCMAEVLSSSSLRVKLGLLCIHTKCEDLAKPSLPDAQVEQSEHCARVLRKRQEEGWLPPGEVHPDVTTYTPSAEIKKAAQGITGGFPCQALPTRFWHRLLNGWCVNASICDACTLWRTYARQAEWKDWMGSGVLWYLICFEWLIAYPTCVQAAHQSQDFRFNSLPLLDVSGSAVSQAVHWF